jgi:aspartate racemase
VKTIGVLGGLGPQATMDFELRVHRAAQQLVPPHGNGGYPPMVVYYYRFVPFVATEDGAPELPLRPDPRLVDAAARIGGMVDFIVITSNFLHLFQAEIEQAAGCHVLSMIEVTLAEVDRRGWSRVGVLGFGDPVVYTIPLGEMGLAIATIVGDLRARLDGAIHEVMEGRDDGIILGCTEIPLLLGDLQGKHDLVNPLQLLADAAVNYALT